MINRAQRSQGQMRIETAVTVFVNAAFFMMIGGAGYVAAAVVFP